MATKRTVPAPPEPLKANNDLMEYVMALEPAYRKKGKKLLRKIFPLLSLDKDGHVIYINEDNDNITGSHLLDLLTYVLSKGKESARPLDYDLFIALLSELGVVKQKQNSWINLY